MATALTTVTDESVTPPTPRHEESDDTEPYHETFTELDEDSKVTTRKSKLSPRATPELLQILNITHEKDQEIQKQAVMIYELQKLMESTSEKARQARIKLEDQNYRDVNKMTGLARQMEEVNRERLQRQKEYDVLAQEHKRIEEGLREKNHQCEAANQAVQDLREETTSLNRDRQELQAQLNSAREDRSNPLTQLPADTILTHRTSDSGPLRRDNPRRCSSPGAETPPRQATRQQEQYEVVAPIPRFTSTPGVSFTPPTVQIDGTTKQFTFTPGSRTISWVPRQ